jgi:hypothetical protein
MAVKRIKAKNAVVGMILNTTNRNEVITEVRTNDDNSVTIYSEYFYGSSKVTPFCRFESNDTFRIVTE